jgi:mycothiol synthase
MTRSAPAAPNPPPGVPEVHHAGPELLLPAAMRLVSQHVSNRELAARRFLASAPSHRIDLSLLWVTLKPRTPARRTPVVSQVCLLVPGSGRTAMTFLSEPDPTDPAPERDGRAVAERAACIGAAVTHAASHLTESVKLAQGLPSPSETWSIAAYNQAGFTHAGDLSYIRTSLPHPVQAQQPAPWPPGIRVVSLRQYAQELGTPERSPAIDQALTQALNRSYVDTLDCPELCGLRETPDVLDSHRATGICDPSLWFLVLLNDQPAGCMLLSRCPDQRCVELVYLGLGPEVRGKGLGKHLLHFGIRAITNIGEPELCCAVDRRNVPALRLYTGLGFLPFSERVALVKKP